MWIQKGNSWYWGIYQDDDKYYCFTWNWSKRGRFGITKYHISWQIVEEIEGNGPNNRYPKLMYPHHSPQGRVPADRSAYLTKEMKDKQWALIQQDPVGYLVRQALNN